MVITNIAISAVSSDNNIPYSVTVDCTTNDAYDGTFNVNINGGKTRVRCLSVICSQEFDELKAIFRYFCTFTIMTNTDFIKVVRNLERFAIKIDWFYLGSAGNFFASYRTNTIRESSKHHKHQFTDLARSQLQHQYNSNLTQNEVDLLHMYDDIVYFDLEPNIKFNEFDFWEKSGYYYIAIFTRNMLMDDVDFESFMANSLYLFGFDTYRVIPAKDVELFDVSEDGINYSPISETVEDLAITIVLIGLLYFCFTNPRLCIIVSDGTFFRRNSKIAKILAHMIADIYKFNAACSQFIIVTDDVDVEFEANVAKDLNVGIFRSEN